ncbi:peptidyl-tRNA hydrolase PTH2 [Encephalitozoon intestinalis ATCC 50506]|uniref:peptidyl-tRNA hydrolase n=1 Tax=Encephalitozoon intestinalis (strain ATCC 50506) TaxID=876142 RepID=W8P8X3_ENCIT|nr:peptidyl-tRNA hydrolase PTH2 [Encephalitozoon intestinalis ATCC 50506]AHL30088.1 peptidyl-tRNA hydrolase PTH2 [Encephalitozoon intestinalis ATCC 50506]UTX45020.1 peptidyl-tRNA hydrolase PTH2 [Encephalitozoon intestinalis]
MTVVQYILLRSDLSFSRGAVIAQACHSSVYSIEKYRNHPDTIEYLENIESMAKIILKIKEKDVEEIAGYLTSKGIDHTVWIEDPERIPTCISLRPYKRSHIPDVVDYLARFGLFR